VSGQTFSIESANRLGDWFPLTNVTITNGVGQFIDPSATNHNSHFYQALPIIK
jgi:hypothetical protein